MAIPGSAEPFDLADEALATPTRLPTQDTRGAITSGLSNLAIDDEPLHIAANVLPNDEVFSLVGTQVIDRRTLLYLGYTPDKAAELWQEWTAKYPMPTLADKESEFREHALKLVDGTINTCNERDEKWWSVIDSIGIDHKLGKAVIASAVKRGPRTNSCAHILRIVMENRFVKATRVAATLREREERAKLRNEEREAQERKMIQDRYKNRRNSSSNSKGKGKGKEKDSAMVQQKDQEKQLVAAKAHVSALLNMSSVEAQPSKKERRAARRQAALEGREKTDMAELDRNSGRLGGSHVNAAVGQSSSRDSSSVEHRLVRERTEAAARDGIHTAAEHTDEEEDSDISDNWSEVGFSDTDDEDDF